MLKISYKNIDSLIGNVKLGKSISSDIETVLNDDFIWAGKNTSGVNYASLNADKLDTLTYPDKLLSQSVWSVFKNSDNFLMIGTSDDLSIINDTQVQKNTEINGIDLSYIMAITESDDAVWLGDLKQRLLKYQNDKLEKVNLSGVNNLSIRLLLFDQEQNTLWIGTKHNGLYRLNLTTNKVYSYQKNTLPSNKVRALYLDKNQMLWIGTGNGLTRLNTKTNQFNLDIGVNNNALSLSDEDVRAIQPVGNSRYLLATGNGLTVLDFKNKTKQFFIEKSGLPKFWRR